jgi:hypothetical protein
VGYPFLQSAMRLDDEFFRVVSSLINREHPARTNRPESRRRVSYESSGCDWVSRLAIALLPFEVRAYQQAGYLILA